MLLLAALLAAAPVNEDLAKAQKAFEELKYADATKALDSAWGARGNDRETVLEILKLQAIVAAATGQADKARALFRTLLYLAPDFVLPDNDLGPKVMSVFYEAKGRVAVDGALTLDAGADRDTQAVQKVTVKVKDTQGLALTVRFHVRAPGFEWKTTDVVLMESAASAEVNLPAVEWWAELLGEKDRVLARAGSAEAPIAVTKATLVPKQEAPPVVATAPASPLKGLAYGAAGAGIVAGVVGVIFGVQANGSKALIENAARDGSGRVTGITRQTALQINESQKTSALLANTLFVASGVLVATGIVLFVAAPGVTVQGGAGGISVGGAL